MAGARRFGRIFGRAPQVEVNEELEFHLEERVRDYVARGMDPDAARAAALRRLGNLDAIRGECVQLLESERRSQARRDWLDDLRQDLRFGARSAARAPLFTLLAIVTLALGIGANAAIFGVVKSVLLDSLPYADAGRLVQIYSRFADSEMERSSTSPGAFMDLDERLRSFSSLTAFNWGTFDVTLLDERGPRVLSGAAVTGDFLSTLGVVAAAGRTLTEADAPLPVVMLSHSLWEHEFGRAADVIGRTLRISGGVYEVVGVLPRGFVGPMGAADIWFAWDLAPALAGPDAGRDQHYLGMVGRLAPGVSLAAARQELRALDEQLAREHPRTDVGRSFLALPLRDAMVGETRTPLLVLLASAALVLLATCANLAGALLSRTLSRRKEFAVRVALGAGRGRVVRQLLTESVVLAFVGAAAGLLLAELGLSALRGLALPVLPAYADLTLDRGAVLATVLVALVTGVAFGVAPALTVGRTQPQGTLREEQRGASESRRSRRLRGALVAAQIALSLSLLTGAALLVRSLWLMTTAPAGFDPDGVVAGNVVLQAQRYATPEARVQFFDELATQLRAQPGVVDVATMSQLPSPNMTHNKLTIEGVTLPGDGPVFISYVSASDDLFRTLRIPLRAGRTFGPEDTPDGTPAIVISETMARRYWPNDDPVGRRIRISPQTEERWGVIIGVVADLRTDPALPQPEPLVYASNRQDISRTGRTFLVRTERDPVRFVGTFERVLAAMDPEMPLRNPITLRAWIDERLAPQRLPMLLMTAFGALALVLACVGVYALFAGMAAARETEFGVRMALGSSPRAIAALVLRQGAVWMLIGLAGGIAGVAFVATMLRNLLYGVTPFDPLALGASLLTLVVCGTVALLVPVRRATRVDPVTVLR